jgi:hypothetical protein
MVTRSLKKRVSRPFPLRVFIFYTRRVIYSAGFMHFDDIAHYSLIFIALQAVRSAPSGFIRRFARR